MFTDTKMSSPNYFLPFYLFNRVKCSVILVGKQLMLKIRVDKNTTSIKKQCNQVLDVFKWLIEEDVSGHVALIYRPQLHPAATFCCFLAAENDNKMAATLQNNPANFTSHKSLVLVDTCARCLRCDQCIQLQFGENMTVGKKLSEQVDSREVVHTAGAV